MSDLPTAEISDVPLDGMSDISLEETSNISDEHSNLQLAEMSLRMLIEAGMGEFPEPDDAEMTDADVSETETVDESDADSDATETPDDVIVAGSWPEIATHEPTPALAPPPSPARFPVKPNQMIYAQGAIIPLPVCDAKSGLLHQLSQMTPKRLVIVKQHGGINNGPRQEYLKSIWLQAVGDEKPAECIRCAKGLGPFLGCISLVGVVDNSCANCHWGSGARVHCRSAVSSSSTQCDLDADYARLTHERAQAIAELKSRLEEVIMEKTLDNQLDAMVAVFRRDAEKAEQRRIAAESLRYDHRWGPHYTQAPGPSYDYSNGFEQQRVLPSIEQPGFGQAEQSPEAKVKVEECEEQDREPSRDYEYPTPPPPGWYGI